MAVILDGTSKVVVLGPDHPRIHARGVSHARAAPFFV
jgi:hypothetical protein